jgi:hypothetical protein
MPQVLLAEREAFPLLGTNAAISSKSHNFAINHAPMIELLQSLVVLDLFNKGLQCHWTAR